MPFYQLSVVVKEFKKLCKTSCYKSRTYGSYTSLLAAKHACREDVGCAKVLDVGCDFENVFKLCPFESSLTSDIGSCIYIDETKSSGKCFYISSFIIPL